MSLIDSPDTATLPKLLRRNSRNWPTAPAIREKDRGIWRTWTWRDYYEHARNFALGLAALEFKRGEKLTVIGDNRKRLYAAQLSAQALGGISVPVYQDSIASELAFVLEHAEVAIVVAEDQEQVDKILSLKDKLPALRWVIYDDPRGLSDYKQPFLRSADAVEALGREFAQRHPDYFEREIEAGQSDDIAMIAYTSGTTGNPKGAMLSHGNMISVSERFGTFEGVKAGDNWLAYLPMAWVGDAAFSLGLSLVTGAVGNCPESPETVQRDLRELGPAALLAPPRIWENMLTNVQLRAADATSLKRRLYEYFRSRAEQRQILESDGKPIPAGLKLSAALGEFFVYSPVRDQLGLRNARICYTGGAPLGPDTYRFFRSFGINLKQVYGATEATALVACQPDSEARPDTVGRMLPGTDARIDDSGEVQIRGPGIFRGYYKNDQTTRETITPDGWLRTGDAGFFDPQGHLVIIDRAKDVGKLQSGHSFAPQFIENKLKFSPYVREVVAFGDQRAFVVAMVAIDMTTVGNWAERKGLAYTSYMDLARKPEIAALVGEEIARANATLPEDARVRRFLLLQKDLDADDAEVTRTRKVRRRFVAEKYADVIEAFYNGAKNAAVSMQITFEDGRRATLDTTLDIYDVQVTPPAARAAA